MSDEDFRTWLARERERLNVSYFTVARFAGVSVQTVRNAETGTVRTSSRDAIRRALKTLERDAEQGALATREDLDELTRLVERMARTNHILLEGLDRVARAIEQLAARVDPPRIDRPGRSDPNHPGSTGAGM